jgi:hypothetical protein
MPWQLNVITTNLVHYPVTSTFTFIFTFNHFSSATPHLS